MQVSISASRTILPVEEIMPMMLYYEARPVHIRVDRYKILSRLVIIRTCEEKGTSCQIGNKSAIENEREESCA
jgi:hypothetical protein